MAPVPACACQRALGRLRGCVAHRWCSPARTHGAGGGGAAPAHPQLHERRQPCAPSCVGGGHWRWRQCPLALASVLWGGRGAVWHMAGALRRARTVPRAVEPLPHTPSCMSAASRAHSRVWEVVTGDGASARLCLPACSGAVAGLYGTWPVPSGAHARCRGRWSRSRTPPAA